MKKGLILLLILSFFSLASSAQKIIEDVIIRTDSADYSFKTQAFQIRKSNYLYFVLNKINQEVEVSIKINPEYNVEDIHLLQTPEFVQLDSLIQTEENTFIVDIRFASVFDVGFPKLVFEVFTDSLTKTEEVKPEICDRVRDEALSHNKSEVYIRKHSTAMVRTQTKQSD